MGTHAYKLRLPVKLRRLHPVFPVVKLTPAPVDPFSTRPHPSYPPPELVDGREEYEVEEVLDSRMWRNGLQYLVKWKGYGYEDNEWVKPQDMHAPEAIEKFHHSHPDAPRSINTEDVEPFKKPRLRRKQPGC